MNYLDEMITLRFATCIHILMILDTYDNL